MYSFSSFNTELNELANMFFEDSIEDKKLPTDEATFLHCYSNIILLAASISDKKQN
jgi:hypothetical protein